MLDGLVTLMEWLLKLVEARGQKREALFDRYVKPVYEEVEKVYRDYLTLLTETKNELERGTEMAVLIERLEQGRLENKPVRDKMRAALAQEKLNSEDLSVFERGVLGVLRGGLSRFESSVVYDLGPYSRGGHTLLCVIHRLQRGGHDENRLRYSAFVVVQEQLESLDRAWKDVVEGYAKLQMGVLK